ncbi:hypothetical protein [Aureivirga sp. CE67]|uniref:hypothetical protein n=1 Tax=Aureivirga sp. CE67 TaxID=1788983 RepID=UPI0018C9FAF1|nr:hypothetical protein [Aureivirga sp. CE67]
MKNHLLFSMALAASFNFSTSFGQVSPGTMKNIQSQQLTFNETGSARAVQEITRSKELNPFLKKNWSIGHIEIDDNTIISKDRMHYNLENGTINLVSYDDDNEEVDGMFYQLDNSTIRGFRIFDSKNNTPRDFLKIDKSYFEKPNSINAVFFETFEPNVEKPKLVKEIYKVKTTIKKSAARGYSGARPAESGVVLKKYVKYYVLHNEKYVRTKLSNSKILKLYSDKKNSLKKYIKENKLNCKKPLDAIAVLNYYYSLK